MKRKEQIPETNYGWNQQHPIDWMWTAPGGEV